VRCVGGGVTVGMKGAGMSASCKIWTLDKIGDRCTGRSCVIPGKLRNFKSVKDKFYRINACMTY